MILKLNKLLVNQQAGKPGSVISTHLALYEDYEFVYNVKKQALGPYITQIWGWDEDLQQIFHRKKFDPSRLQIITLNGQDIGTIEVLLETDYIAINQLFILPEYQGQGIGTYLLEATLRRAQELRLPVELQVLKINPAQRLYQRLGFVPIGETETHIKMQAS